MILCSLIKLRVNALMQRPPKTQIYKSKMFVFSPYFKTPVISLGGLTKILAVKA